MLPSLVLLFRNVQLAMLRISYCGPEQLYLLLNKVTHSVSISCYELISVNNFCSCTGLTLTLPMSAKMILYPFYIFRSAVGPEFLFMNNNSLRNRTVAVKELLERENIQCMDLLARFPCLNPIEHMWYFLWRHLASYDQAQETIPQLKLAF